MKSNAFFKKFFLYCQFIILSTLITMFPISLFAAEESLFTLSLEELMDVEIKLPSKKVEPLFEAPLASTVLTRNDIEQSGALSIPEALRLVPGLIVRETANGIFDVHIRGAGSIPPYSDNIYAVNTTSLLMIDNRIVYDYYYGGIPWDALPIDLNDIERIEIVRGPAAAMYGPNAVSGVIHILTKRPEKEGYSCIAEVTGGGFTNDFSAVQKGEMSLWNKSERLLAGLSGNFDKRKRSDVEYYSWNKNPPGYVDQPEDIVFYEYNQTSLGKEWADRRYPDPDVSLNKYGINGFLNFKPTPGIDFDLSGGHQDSRAQKIFRESGVTPFLTYDNTTFYGNLNARANDLTLHLDYTDGKTVTLGHNDATSDDTMNMSVFHSGLEYDFKKGDFLLRPGVGYHSVNSKSVTFGGISGEPANTSMDALSVCLRSEYTFLNGLRIIGGLWADKYDFKDQIPLNYMLAGTYPLSDRHIVRASAGRAYRSPFLIGIRVDHFNNYGPPFLLNFKGNEEMDQLKNDTYELGYRGKLSNHLQIDTELFYSVSEDYSNRFRPLEGDLTIDVNGDTYNLILYQNQEMRAEQIGLTVSLNCLFKKVMGKIYATFQKTTLNGTVYVVDWEDLISPLANTYEEYSDETHKATPDIYGGVIFNYTPVDKLHVNLNSYYYTKQSLLHEHGVTEVAENILLNTKISYDITKNINVYANMRNLNLMGEERQYGGADKIDTMFLLGVGAEF